ncbi:MAG: hypothetical protein IJ620_05430 [Bacteroidales bacterium]|nr:hypothetical protein [Bacteroidales bacterium]
MMTQTQKARQAETQIRMEQALSPDTATLYWTKMIEANKQLPQRLLNSLETVEVVLEDKCFVLHTTNSYLESEIRPFLVAMLDWLRAASGIDDLTCRIELKIIETRPEIYSAQERLDAMVKVNPLVADLFKMLNNIDIA